MSDNVQNMLRGRTFSAPRKWARGKGRVTVQFGCCYNYAKDNQGRLPGKLGTPLELWRRLMWMVW